MLLKEQDRKLWTAEELANHKFERPTFLVEPIIPLGGLVLLHGKRGIGKTQLCLTLANSITTGREFLGRYPTSRGPVVKVQVDMTPQIQQLRIQKVSKLLKLDDLYYVFPRVLNICNLERESELVIKINELQPLIIIWDTLRKIHRENENNSESAQIVYSKVVELFPEVTHFFVHHDKKTIVDQQSLDPEEAFRGSGDWIDSTDTSMQLVSLKRKNPSRVMLYFHKARTAPDTEKSTCLLQMDPDTMLMVPFNPPAKLRSLDTHPGNCDQLSHRLLGLPNYVP